MLKKIECWKKVIRNETLLQTVSQCSLDDVATMAKLRKKWTVDEITVAGKLNEARKKAAHKLEYAKELISDSIGVQQATSSAIASHKAKRFINQKNIFDLCCGIGADLRALPEHSAGVDNDPLRSWMAQENTKKTVRTADVTTIELPPDCVIHIDPARRNSSGRIFELDAMLPTFSEVATIANSVSGGCIKLSPAINPEDMIALSLPIEIEYIEEKNRLVQAAVWFGLLANNQGQVTATSIKHGVSYTGTTEQPDFATALSNWILEPNVALERACLHGTLGNTFNATEPAPGIGLLTSEENPGSPWFTAFEILETTSLRIEKVAKIVRALGCTQVEVKTRGKTIDPNAWQKKLNKKSTGPLLTIFALRLGKKRVALVTRRCAAL